MKMFGSKTIEKASIRSFDVRIQELKSQIRGLDKEANDFSAHRDGGSSLDDSQAQLIYSSVQEINFIRSLNITEEQYDRSEKLRILSNQAFLHKTELDSWKTSPLNYRDKPYAEKMTTRAQDLLDKDVVEIKKLVDNQK